MIRSLSLLALSGILALAQTTTSVVDTLRGQDGANFLGELLFRPTSPACRLTVGTQSYALTSKKYCLGVTGASCNVSVAAGVINIPLVPTIGSTPAGCSYAVTVTERNGITATETWDVPPAGPVLIKDVRVQVVPTPSLKLRMDQLDPQANTGCLSASGASVVGTGQVCGAGPGIPFFAQSFTSASTIVVPQTMHGKTGNIVVTAYDTAGNEIEASVNVSGGLAVTIIFAVPTSGIYVISGGTGTGFYSATLTTATTVIPAVTHGLNHPRIIGRCYTAAGDQFTCAIQRDPATFEITVRMTPFTASTIVLQGL